MYTCISVFSFRRRRRNDEGATGNRQSVSRPCLPLLVIFIVKENCKIFLACRMNKKKKSYMNYSFSETWLQEGSRDGDNMPQLRTSKSVKAGRDSWEIERNET